MYLDGRKLGNNIKKYRMEKGISQEALVRKANLKLSNLAKLEGGFNHNPTLTSLSSIANMLTNGSIDKLLM